MLGNMVSHAFQHLPRGTDMAADRTDISFFDDAEGKSHAGPPSSSRRTPSHPTLRHCRQPVRGSHLSWKPMNRTPGLTIKCEQSRCHSGLGWILHDSQALFMEIILRTSDQVIRLE